jgi:hypothetical protein
VEILLSIVLKPDYETRSAVEIEEAKIADSGTLTVV